MNYDVIIIGGGLAGYSAGLRCLEKGLKTALVSTGQSALHFASGSIDLLSHEPDGKPVQFPLAAIAHFSHRYPKHPYAKLGQHKVKHAMAWFQSTMADADILLDTSTAGQNHRRITPMGGLKTTWMSPRHVYQIDYQRQQHNIDRIVVVDIEGFRDFQAELLADNLRQQAPFSLRPISIACISLDSQQRTRDPHSSRSIDFARRLNDPALFNHFCQQLTAVASVNDLVIIPAIFDHEHGQAIQQKLVEATQLTISEVATMPPSLMGIRLENTLSQRFIKQGGTLLKGDQASQGHFTHSEDGKLQLERINTVNLTDFPLSADHFILASGSFFSRGLTATHDKVIEPLFDLDIGQIPPRADWYQRQLFAEAPQHYLAFGVETDQDFHPFMQGQTVDNLYCTGALLAHYNPIAEGNGGGIAIATAYAAVESISKKIAANSTLLGSKQQSSRPIPQENSQQEANQ